MKKIAVFPGSFDPITNGHVDLVRRSLPIFDEIVVAIGVNTQKKYLFSLAQRVEWLNAVFAEPTFEGRVRVDTFEGLTAKYCNQQEAQWIIRGLRNASDFDYEKTISQLNNIVGHGLETFFLIAQPQYSHVSSTIVRELIKGGGDVSAFVPPQIKLA